MAVANALEIPLVNWDLSPRAFLANSMNNFEVSLKPPNAQLLADLLLLKGWHNFVYLHDVDSADRGNSQTLWEVSLFVAAQNVRFIYLHLQHRSNESISSEMFQLPKDVDQFGEFLRQYNLKRFRQNATEHIILDTANTYRCTIEIREFLCTNVLFRQQQLLQAIRSAQFNQQKYHYVVANFDFQPYDVEMFQQVDGTSNGPPY